MTIQPAVNFTDNAAKKVYDLIKEENNFNLMLRVYITGGGCSGFQYGFTFDEQTQSDDTIIKKQIAGEGEDGEDGEGGEGGEGGGSVQLLIDPMSIQYLRGAEIDYESDLQGEQFVIRNPNAKTTCGCGASFSID